MTNTANHAPDQSATPTNQTFHDIKVSSPGPASQTLLPGWADYLKSNPVAPKSIEPKRTLPRSPSYYAEKITYVKDKKAAESMLELANQRPLSCIGFDTEFRYDRSFVIDSKHTGY